MKELKDKKILFVTFIVLLLILTTSLSYAYFSTSVKGNDNAKDVVVETGTLKLVYTDSPEIVAEHIKPGWTTTKVVTVKNTGTLDTAYNLVWQELTNEITNNELVISASCERLNSSNAVDGTCESISESPIKSKKIKKNISIESGITHKYTFTITFKEIKQEQNYNQGKSFSGVLGIEEYKDTAIYCTFDGDMVQGAEYVNGQYTYRYMQDGEHSDGRPAWGNISIDGWGVQLTDRESTDDVTDEFCTYINNKPVISTNFMFSYSQATTIDLSSFDTSNVTDMEGMFYGSQATTIDLSSFDTSNVTDMEGMFYGSQATTIDLSSFDTSNVTNMKFMFRESKATSLDLSSFNISKVTDMGYMFSESQATTLDLSSFDTSKVTNMVYMFGWASNLKTIYASDKFNTDAVIDSSGMFLDCTSLVGGSGTTYNSNYKDKTYARIDGGTSNPGYFTAK